MKKYPGIYIGLVVNTNDPEKRGRVQVFVPNVSTTLFSGWNKDGKNLSFTTASFTPPILDRLKNLLPWSEVASNFWGGSTGAPQNETTEKPAVTPPDSSASPDNDKKEDVKPEESPTTYAPNNGANNPEGTFDNKKDQPTAQSGVSKPNSGDSQQNANSPIKTLNDVPDNVLRYLMSIAASETGFSGKEASTDVNNQLANNENVRGSYNNEPGFKPANSDLSVAQSLYGDYGYTQYNYQTEVLGAKKAGVDLAWGSNTTLSAEMLGLAQYMQASFPKTFDAAMAGEWSTADQTLFAQKFKALYNPSNQDVINQYRNASRDELNQQIANVDNGSGPAKIAAKLSSRTQDNQDQKVARPTDLVNYNGPVDVGGRSGSPMGAVSTPMVNSKVLVFFYNDNPNFPICISSLNDCIKTVG